MSAIRFYFWMMVAGMLLIIPWASAGELRIHRSRMEHSRGIVDATLSPTPAEEFEFLVGEAKGTKPFRTEAKTVPLDLWILVDSSALCQTQKVDAYVNALIRGLRKQADRNTLVTLVSYASESIEILARQRPIAEISDTKMECASKNLSSSYDRPLAKLIEEQKKGDLPTVAWVFTSGNIDLSPKTASLVAGRNLELHLVLYNEFIEKEIRPTVQATEAMLKGQKVYFGLLPKIENGIFFPSLRYQIEFGVPPSLQGMPGPLQITARGRGVDVPLAKASFILNIPIDGMTFFWRKYGPAILSVAMALFIAYLVYKTVVYYRPHRCLQCNRRVSFRFGDCLFCKRRESGFLVGTFPISADGFSDTKGNRLEIVPLFQDEKEIGSHRKSPIRLPRRGRARRFVTIRKEKTAANRYAYQIIRSPQSSDIQVEVNGQPLRSNRYLAAGDELVIDTTLMTFYCGGNTHD